MPAIDEMSTMENIWIDDINSNGIQEVVAVTSGIDTTKHTNRLNTVQGFSANGTRTWFVGIDERIFSSLMININNDRNMEVLVASGKRVANIQRGKIRIISSEGNIIRVLDRGEMASAAFRSLDVGDINNDRYYEIVGGSETKAYLMRGYGEIIWGFPPINSQIIEGTISHVLFIDMNADGNDEILVAADQIHIVSPRGNIRGSIDPEPGRHPSNKAYSFIAQAKKMQGRYPGIYAISNSDNIYFITLDEVKSVSGDLEYELSIDWKLEMECSPKAWRVFEIEGRGFDDLIIGCSDNRVYAIGNNGRIRWDYMMDGTPTDIISEDMSGDGNKELLITTERGSIYLLDGSGSYLWKYELNEPLAKVAAGKLIPDETKEIAVLTKGAHIIALGLNETYNLMRKADTLYNLGQQAYIISEYEKAREHFTQSRQIYQKLEYPRGISDSEQFLQRIEQQMRHVRREQADILLSRARDLFFQEEYVESETLARRALDLYEEFGNVEGILNCELLLIQIEKQRGMHIIAETTIPPQVTTTTLAQVQDEYNYTMLYVGGVIVFFIIFGVFARKKKMAKIKNIDGSLDDLSDIWNEDLDEKDGGG